MTFADLGLSPELLKAVEDAGYTTPTAIQAQAIPTVLMMRDLIGIAQTGTGKTASFVLPMIDVMAAGRRRALMPRSLILEPTRELAAQVAENFEKYGKNHDLKMALLIGGVQMGDQLKALSEGVDVLIATPGRLMDLFERGKIMLNGCELLVIDEADRMLDMGFIPDIRRVIEKLPRQRQTLLFSATIPYDIGRLADTILRDPVRVSVAPPSAPAESVEHLLYYVEKADKAQLLKHLLSDDTVKNALVFTRTRHGADRIERTLSRAGIRTEAIHGDKSQGSRERALAAFKKGTIRVLVATDIAARGLDIVELSHVFNYDMPNEPEAYVHRIGRTARAGLSGVAVSFCGFEERPLLADIERLIRKHLTVVQDNPYASPAKPGLPTRLEEGRQEPRPRPYMITVDASFLSAMRSPAAGAPPSRASRHAGDEARPTAGAGGRTVQHRDAARPSRAFRK